VRRSDLAPRAIGFNHERFKWELFDNGKVLSSLERTSVDSDEEAEVDQLESFFECTGKGMDNTTYRRRVRAENRDEVGVAVSRVEEEREVVFRCES